MSDVLVKAALAMERAGNAKEAARLYREILALDPSHFQALYSLANLDFAAARFESAERFFARAAEINPHAADVHFAHGCALQRLTRHAAAVTSFDRAVALDRGHADALVNRAVALIALRRLAEAAASFGQALKLQPARAELWLAHGDVMAALDRPGEAIRSYDKAIALKPGYAEALNNRGAALFALRRYEEAVASYDALLRIMPRNTTGWINRGIALAELKRHAEALTSYDRVLALEPKRPDVLYHRGIALFALQNVEAALESIDASLAHAPGNADALVMRGLLLKDMGRLDEALASYGRALSLKPDSVAALVNREAVLFQQKRYEEAMADCERALALDADVPFVAGDLVYYRLQCCDWRDLDARQTAVAGGLREGKRVIQPFMNLALPGTAETQARCARIWVSQQSPQAQPFPRGQPFRHARLRLAYVSGDFNEHPVSQLMAGVFELHDRSRFETIGVSLGADDGSLLRRRVKSAFDSFLDVRGKTDQEIAALMRGAEVDIAVDLMGHTGSSHAGIFARRAAPVQVNYLGFPGTMGTDVIDYILADRIVCPETDLRSYTEQVVWLPDSYLPVDSRRRAGAPPNRAAAGLPEGAFVFASFNNSYKFTPQVFSIWMRLLQAVPGSVLWLPRNNPAAMRNLAREAQARRIAPERIVFAPFVQGSEAHLARLSLADLFLDTLPCNAHSTAADALQAGVPVLTCRGTSFPGRVAASLLLAARLPELAANSPVEYESTALKLARQREMLAAMRNRLADARDAAPLFDTARTTRALEAAFIRMQERAQSGQGPAHFAVEPP
jgi:protein O-GlcNAc transferase